MWNIKENRETMGAKKGKKKIIIIIGIGILALGGAGYYYLNNNQSKSINTTASEVRTQTVTRGDLVSQLASSGTIQPKDEYSITSLVEGEIVSADFEEGDLVTEGQVLYQIDVSSMESEITSANNSLVRAQESYSIALNDYNEVMSDYGDGIYKATRTGYIQDLQIEVGDKISNNSEIAVIYSEQVMEITVPFLNIEAALIGIGNVATLTIADTQEQIQGVVTNVSSMDEVLDGGRIIRDVTIQVQNPGGLSTRNYAIATVNGFISAGEASFEATVDTTMNAQLSSTVEIAEMLIQEGAYVTIGTPIFRMDSGDKDSLLNGYKNSLDSAEEKLESAQTSIDNINENYDNYTITAPISGQVITKTSKTGDNFSKSTNTSTEMAVIYDMSEVTFQMSIDELDVLKIKVGQKVDITADALEGELYTGTITNISLESVQSNGVTNYPVTVTLDEVGNLLPGMNVDGEIVLDEVEDVLQIPVVALMRNNQVYVKDDSVVESQNGVPAGFRAVTVETGLISTEYVEIISGLNEGDEIYVNSTVESSSMMIPGMMPEGDTSGGQRPSGGGGGGGSRP